MTFGYFNIGNQLNKWRSCTSGLALPIITRCIISIAFWPVFHINDLSGWNPERCQLVFFGLVVFHQKKNPISIDAIKACHLLQVLPVILRISLVQQNYIVYQISLAVIFTEITIDIFTRNIFGFFYKKIQILISKSLLGTYQLIGSPHVVQGSLFPSPRPTWFVAAWNFHTSWICLQPGFLLWVSLSTYSYSQKLDMIDMFVG